jgi:hypothetical protein
MQEWITAAIGVGGALAGTGLGYRGALAINRRDREHAQRVQMRDVFAEYLAAIYQSVAFLQDLPPATEPSAFSRAIDRYRGETATWIALQRSQRSIMGNRHYELAGQVVAALAQLQVLPLPADARAALDAADDYLMRLGEQRTPEIKAEWSRIRARLIAAAEEVGVEPPRRHWLLFGRHERNAIPAPRDDDHKPDWS